MADMTPRERICAAMTGEEVDYPPCSIYFNGNLRASGHDCSRLRGRADLGLELGVDPFVGVGMGASLHPDVSVEAREETVLGERYTVLWQTWNTPGGVLTQAVRKDAACASWKSIRWCDESASSTCKPLIEGREDIHRCRYVMQPTSDAEFERWRRARGEAFDLADEYDLPVVATYGQGLAALLFTMGAERAVLLAVDDPDGFDELAEIIHRVEMRNIELAARAGVHILKRFGGYEMCNFYNPAIFERVCVPRLKKEVARAHEVGLPIFYRIVTGMEPLLETIAGIGFDCIEGGEPRLSACSLERWHEAFSPHASSWTGISTPVLLGGGDPEAVRAEVRTCAGIFGRRGFILGVTNSIRKHFPWENTLAMIDEWKRVR